MRSVLAALVLSSSVVAAGCGRLGFETTIDAGAIDAGPRDAGVDAPADAGPPGEACTRIAALPATPAINGTPDPGVLWQHLDPQGWTSSTDPIPAGLDARFAIGWRPNGLYFVVDVTDPDRFPAAGAELDYCGDAVEVYVDSDGAIPAAPNYDMPGARQFIAEAPPDATTVVTRGVSYRFPEGVATPWTRDVAVAPRPGGYVFEAFVDADALSLASWSLASGRRVGIDLSIDVSRPGPITGTDCGYRLAQYFFHVVAPGGDICGGAPFCNVAAFCFPTLE